MNYLSGFNVLEERNYAQIKENKQIDLFMKKFESQEGCKEIDDKRFLSASSFSEAQMILSLCFGGLWPLDIIEKYYSREGKEGPINSVDIKKAKSLVSRFCWKERENSITIFKKNVASISENYPFLERQIIRKVGAPVAD